MPLATQLTRNNTPLTIRWGWWHLECLEEAWATENLERSQFVPIKFGYNATFFNEAPYTFTHKHEFVDPSDQEYFLILPGDTFNCWRD